MEALDAELLLPARGLPVAGAEQGEDDPVAETATVLEDLARDVLEMMNAGESLDTIVHTVKVDPDLLSRPWLKPRYDDPGVRDPHRVAPVRRVVGRRRRDARGPPTSAVATELAALAGGAERLAAERPSSPPRRPTPTCGWRVTSREWASRAAPGDAAIHDPRRCLRRDTPGELIDGEGHLHRPRCGARRRSSSGSGAAVTARERLGNASLDSG